MDQEEKANIQKNYIMSKVTCPDGSPPFYPKVNEQRKKNGHIKYGSFVNYFLFASFSLKFFLTLRGVCGQRVFLECISLYQN